MKILFHGQTAGHFRGGFEALLDEAHEIATADQALSTTEAQRDFATAEVIIGTRLAADMPRPDRVRLYHSPGAGYDGVALDCLPSAAALCNCFGHERAIAEYVMAALLARQVPLVAADAHLRRGDWSYGMGGPLALRHELGAGTLGIVGYGHIGRAVAALARAFGMGVLVANRSPVVVVPPVDRFFRLDELHDLLGAVDAVVLAVPLTEETRGLIDAAALAAMRPQAVLINVGRGLLVDEAALYDALKARRIGGAVIDTWYVYRSAERPETLPANLPFHELDNVVMTPHMSGWSYELIGRRQRTMAENINSLAAGKPLRNVVRPAGS